jgi:thiamine-phosphate pyrophosphorylase
MSRINGLHVVTDSQLCPGRDHREIARVAVNASAPVIQLRDKHLSDSAFYEVALALRDITRRAGALFIVNDRVGIALAVNADGAHVGQSDMPAPAARRLVGNDFILGVSASSIEEALRAEDDGADYIGFGPVFSTATKTDAGAPTGIELLKELKQAVRAPVVAIGGIGENNIASVAAAGADAAAVVSAIVCAPDMQAAVERLSSLFSGSTC